MELKTNYLGMELRNPLVVSANPLTEDVSNIKKMEDAGASAVVLFSLFEEQLTHEELELHHHTTHGTDAFAEATSYFPKTEEYRTGPEEYLKLISLAKDSVGIPVIASLNGASPGGWTDYALQMQNAGASALELNIYNIPTSLELTGSKVEEAYISIVKAVKEAVSIPVAVKLSPYFTNFANFALQLDEAGADAMVLFNRFYQPDIDLDNLEVTPNVLLSHSSANRVPMRWIAILKDRINANFAATGGIHTGEDVIKLIMVGANATMLCSAILRNGIGHIKQVKEEVVRWMEEHEYESIQQMQGSMSQLKSGQPAQFERAQYMKALTNYKVTF